MKGGKTLYVYLPIRLPELQGETNLYQARVNTTLPSPQYEVEIFNEPPQLLCQVHLKPSEIYTHVPYLTGNLA